MMFQSSPLPPTHWCERHRGGGIGGGRSARQSRPQNNVQELPTRNTKSSEILKSYLGIEMNSKVARNILNRL